MTTVPRLGDVFGLEFLDIHRLLFLIITSTKFNGTKLFDKNIHTSKSQREKLQVTRIYKLDNRRLVLQERSTIGDQQISIMNEDLTHLCITPHDAQHFTYIGDQRVFYVKHHHLYMNNLDTQNEKEVYTLATSIVLDVKQVKNSKVAIIQTNEKRLFKVKQENILEVVQSW